MKTTVKQMCGTLIDKKEVNGHGSAYAVYRAYNSAIQDTEETPLVIDEDAIWAVLAEGQGCKENKEDCVFGKCHSWGRCKVLVEKFSESLATGKIVRKEKSHE